MAKNTFTHYNALRWLAYRAGSIHPRRGANRRPDNRDLDHPCRPRRRHQMEGPGTASNARRPRDPSSAKAKRPSTAKSYEPADAALAQKHGGIIKQYIRTAGGHFGRSSSASRPVKLRCAPRR